MKHEINFAADETYTVTCSNLSPDQEYRLVVKSAYLLKNITGSWDYINRTFYTDSSGLNLDKAYAKEDGFVVTLERMDYSKRPRQKDHDPLIPREREIMRKEVSATELADPQQSRNTRHGF